MKNIKGVAFLILVTAHLGFTQELMLFSMLQAIAFNYISVYTIGFFNTNCSGICLPKPVSNVCPIVYNNAGCPYSRICCAFPMRIEINLPNVTDPSPLNVSKLIVNIAGDTTLKDKETSNENYITTIPSTTYKTTDVVESEEEKNKIKEEEVEQDKDNISCSGVCIESHLTKYCEAYHSSPDLCRSGKLCCVTKSSYVGSLPTDLVVPSQSIRTTEQSITTVPKTSDPQKSSGRECTGECVSGIVSLLCPDIDTDASCPSEEKCCHNPMGTQVTTSSPTTTQQASSST